jgi:ABC-type antimicrobial peptide transport system permease subunit
MLANAFVVSPKLIVPVAVFALLMVALAFLGKVPIHYNVRNLLVRWRVTLLTALAFTMVVGLLTVMLAFVNGMYKLTEGSGQPGNVIVLADGATDELFSNLGYADTSDVSRHPNVLRNDKNEPLTSWELYVVVNQPIPEEAVKGTRKRRFVQVRGLDDPVISGQVHGLPLHEGGKWFSSEGVQPIPGGAPGENAIQAVLGEGIARELGNDLKKPSLELGDVFEVGPRKWMVVGILQSSGSTFDSEIWAKGSLVGDTFGKQGAHTTAVLRTADADKAQETADDLTANFKKSAVQAKPETEYYDQLNGTNQVFLYAIIFVAIFIAIGGVFGIMNTMFAAISQRTKDIGVLRILGFARWQILVSFFLEALLLAVIGGLIGCAVGSVANGWTASSIISSGQGGGGKSVVLKLVVDGNIVLAGLLFSLVMGFIGGLVPALSAMRLRPLESVR